MRSHPRMLAAAALSLGGLSGVLMHDSGVPVGARPGPAIPPTVAAAAAEPLPRTRRALEALGAPAGAERVDDRVRRVETALDMLETQVRKQSHPEALRLAFQAYYNFRTAHPEKVRKPYLYFVDYGLDSRTPRGYVFDMERLTVVDGPFAVAHGRGSAPTPAGVPTRFSNRRGSNSTSLGLYLAQETYAFSGKAGGSFYRSTGLRLRGLSGLFNSRARERGVVVHGAPYVTARQAGRSEGCPAMEQGRARKLIPMISNGGMVFLFSPLDRAWLRSEPWAHDLEGKLAGLRG